MVSISHNFLNLNLFRKNCFFTYSVKYISAMDCPVCSKEYPLSKIEEHVEKCLSMGNDDDRNPQSPQTKRTFPFEDNGKNPPPKKPKIQDLGQTISKGESSKDIAIAGKNKNENFWSNNLRDKSEAKKTAIVNGNKNSNSSNNAFGDQGGNKKAMAFSNAKKNPNPSSMNTFGDMGMQRRKDHQPLAEKLRPSSLLSYIGQKQLLGPQTVLRRLLDNREIPSMILWGPPGCGKDEPEGFICNLTNQLGQLVPSKHGTDSWVAHSPHDPENPP